MPAKKGQRPPNAGKGRPKGALNKATRDVRKAIALVAEGNVWLLGSWLKRVARREPAKAADIFLRMIEYHIPKLQRSEITGKDGKSLPSVVRVEFVHGA